MRSVTVFSKVYETAFNEILKKLMIILAMVKPHLKQNVNCEWFKAKESKSFRSLFYASECGIFFLISSFLFHRFLCILIVFFN